jgi:autophagy-related protein 2
LRNGKTAELMNFFHFDGSEMTLRHLVVTGVRSSSIPFLPYLTLLPQISGATTLSSLVQDIWTPDVKAHQLADVISGIAPVRSVVSVGSGVANLVLLPIEQYRKDGRVVRGLQKGAQAFAKQTTLEAINVGAKLANGTQVILEQAEHVLGARFSAPLSAEALPPSPTAPTSSSSSSAHFPSAADEPTSDDDRLPIRSRYASQPANVKQGVESAYKSLGENFKEAAQTILAVPMEVYERSGSEVRPLPFLSSSPSPPLLRAFILPADANESTLDRNRVPFAPSSEPSRSRS